jgi:hypothetical protein
MGNLLDESEVKELLRKVLKENKHQWVLILILEVVVLLHLIVDFIL